MRLAALALLLAVRAFAAVPVLFYSDITSGPNSGNSDTTYSATGGAYVTLYGNFLGSSQGGSTITLNGGSCLTVVSWGGTWQTLPDGTVWQQKIVVKLGTGCTTGNFVVTTSGGTSNGIPFTVRSGSMYYVSTSGNDANAGTFGSPWRTIPKATNTIASGDTIYVENGVTVTTQDPFQIGGYQACVQINNNISGSSGNPKALLAYPGATVTIGQNSASPACQPAIYVVSPSGAPLTDWVIAGMTLRGGSSGALGINGGLAFQAQRLRFVANDGDCPFANGAQGCMDNFNAINTTWYGNNLHNVSTSITPGTVTALQQGFYLGDGSHDFEFGWNIIANVKACRGFQQNTSTTGETSYSVSIHDNIIHDTACDGIVVVNLDSSKGSGWTLYNNILYNVGVGPQPPDGGATNGMNLQTWNVTANGTATIYNNTIYNCGTVGTPGNSTCFIWWPESGFGTAILTNNIIYPPNNSSPYIYILSSGSGSICTTSCTTVSGTKNLMFGQGAPPAYALITSTVNSDPLFVNAGIFNFQLQSGSPARNGGATIGAVTRDILGVSLPQGVGYPIGALAYNSGSPPPPAITVSGITFDGIGDSSVRAIFNASASYNAMRVRYGTSSCASGSGTVQTNTTSASTFTLYAMTADLAGLAPSTTYHVCPEVSSDGGMNWSTGADATFATVARNATPVAPQSVMITFPAQTGTVRNVMSDCSDLQTQINASVGGDTVVIPAGTVCTGIYTTPTAPEALTFSPSNVKTSTSVITVSSTGFTENQEVRLSSVLTDYLPGNTLYPNGLNSDKGGGWRKGGKYYVHIPDSTHVQLLNTPSGSPVIPGWVTATAQTSGSTLTITPTVSTAPGGYASASSTTSIAANTPFQLVSSGTLPSPLAVDTTYYWLSPCASTQNATCVSQISASSGGSPITITTTGTGTLTIVDQGSGTLYIAPAPTQTTPWVLIKSSGTLPPEPVRVASNWDSQMAIMRNNTLLPTSGYSTPRFNPGVLAHNWRIQGIKFDTGTNTDYLTSTDPRPYCGGPQTGQDNSFIIFDQIRVQGPGAPNRFGCQNGGFSGMFLNGYNVGVINSDLEGLDFWFTWVDPINAGFLPTRASSTQVTFAPGIVHAANGGTNTLLTTTTTGTINITGGSATGTCYVAGLINGTISLVCPTGTTGTCVVTGVTCNLTTSASPAYPTVSLGGSNRAAGVQLFTITLAGGAVSTVALGDPNSTVGPPQNFNGANAIIAGNGPGPFIYYNNTQSGTGLTLHFDDGGGPLLPRGDYTITRNTFNIPTSQIATQVGSDGLRYNNRQPIEWKGGQRINMDGNILNNCFNEISAVSVCSAFTPRGGGYVTDVSQTNNSFLVSTGGTNLLSPIDTFSPVSKPGARQLIQNNLFTLSGWTRYVVNQANPRGWVAYGDGAQEDLTINHNTVYNNLGGIPAFTYMTTYPMGGVSMLNNVFFYTGNWPMLASESVSNCTGLTDTAFANCAFTAGPGNPSYGLSNNIFIPSWASTGPGAPSGFVGTSTVTSKLTNAGNFIPAGASQPANVALVNFLPSLGLSPSSPYHNQGSDGTDPGINPTTLMAAQGALTLTSVTPSTNSASFAYTVWAGTGEVCYVQLSLDGFNTYSSVADSGTGTGRTTNITGLASSSTYAYRILCSSSNLTGNVSTSGTPPTLTCDLNHDGVFNVLDVQLMNNQVLGITPCTNNLTMTGSCNATDSQRVINAALGLGCKIGP